MGTFWARTSLTGKKICIRSKQLVTSLQKCSLQYFVTFAVKVKWWRKQCKGKERNAFFSQIQNDFPLSANSKNFSPKTVLDQLFVQVIALFFDVIGLHWLGILDFNKFDLVSTVARTTAKYNCQIQLSNRTSKYNIIAKYKTRQSDTKWYSVSY